MQFGLRRSVPLMLGIAVGLTTLAVAASLGLAGVLFEAPHVELVVRSSGTAYLLWLAWGVTRSGAPGTATLTQPRRFRAGVLLLWRTRRPGPSRSARPARSPPPSTARSGWPSCSASLALRHVLAGALVLARGRLARLLTRPWHWRALNVTLAALVVASIVPMWLEG